MNYTELLKKYENKNAIVNGIEAKQLREKNIADLAGLVASKRIEVSRLRAELSIGRVKDLKIVKKARKDLAQIQSVLREEQLASEVK